MMRHCLRIATAIYLIASLSAGAPVFAQAGSANAGQQQSQNTSPPNQAAATYPSLLLKRDYSKGKRAFPNIFAPYTTQSIAHPALTNAPGIYSLIQDGKLNLSLQDAIALALQNNLDIAVSEYTPWIDETQILNAKGGGTPFGQFVVGGGGGGSFDPVIAVNSSMNYISQTVNNPLTSGVGGSSTKALTQTSHDMQVNLVYTQELHSGTLFNVVLDNDRNSSSPSANVFNPAITSRLIVAISQPLLNGWGFLPHTRFILEAQNNTQIGKLQFEEQVINSVTQLQIQYWNLVFDRQAVEVAKQTLAAYQKLYEDDERQLKIGSMSPSDVVFAESFIAQYNQLLIGAQANERVQAAEVVRLITKDPSDPKLQGLDIVPITPLQDAPQIPTITVDDAVKEALASRPEVKVNELTLRNDNYDVRATKNALLPALTLNGEYASIGLSGNTPGAFIPNGTFTANRNVPIVETNGAPAVDSNGIPIFLSVANGAFGPVTPGGIGGAYSQIFNNRSPEYAGSLNLNLPLRNRSAQAANAQDQLKERQDQLVEQRQKNVIITSVHQALDAVNLDAAQVNAAVKATQLAQESYDYEVKKFNLAQSSTYFVVQYASILNNAKLAELQAKAAFEIALATFNQALGRTLAANNITIAKNGQRDFDFLSREPLIPGTIDGRLRGSGAAAATMR